MAFAALAFTPATAPSGEIVVPLRVQDRNNMMLVDCKVDGVPCTLIFDTGATHTSLDRTFAARALPDSKTEDVVVAGETNVRDKPVSVRVKTLSVGGAEFGGFSVMSVNLGHLSGTVGTKVDGVLGMNVISRVPCLLSAGTGKVVFNPSESRLEGFGQKVRSASPDPLEIAFGMRNRSGRFAILVDSGASFTFMNSRHWPKAEGDVDLGASDVNGKGAMKATRGATAPLQLGTPIEITPLVGDDAPDCIGADTLKRYDMLIEAPFARFRALKLPHIGGC